MWYYFERDPEPLEPDLLPEREEPLSESLCLLLPDDERDEPLSESLCLLLPDEERAEPLSESLCLLLPDPLC